MDIALVVLGVFVLGVTYLDVLWTTMGEGGGPITRRLTRVMWSGILKLARHRRKDLFLRWGGIAITLFAVVVWILFMWVGWTLVFSGGDETIVHSQSRLPARLWERVYFVGFTIFTLGVGDFVPKGGIWQVLTAVASLSGLFLVTFSITYLVPVVQAATSKRRLAVFIASIGLSAEEILINTWNGEDCNDLAQHLASVASELVMLQQRHLTYPVLHYLHSQSQPEAISLRVAALDEAVTLLQHGMRSRCGVSEIQLRLARQIITEFIATLEASYIGPAEDTPPPPSLDALRVAGMPVVDEAHFHRALSDLSYRRRLLLSFVENDGWAWDMLRPSGRIHDPDRPLKEETAQEQKRAAG